MISCRAAVNNAFSTPYCKNMLLTSINCLSFDLYLRLRRIKLSSLTTLITANTSSFSPHRTSYYIFFFRKTFECRRVKFSVRDSRFKKLFFFHFCFLLPFSLCPAFKSFWIKDQRSHQRKMTDNLLIDKEIKRQ